MTVELTTRTGDVDKSTNADAWIGRFNGALMTNPIRLNYLHDPINSR